MASGALILPPSLRRWHGGVDCWIVTSTSTPSTRRLLDAALVDFHTGLGADVGAIGSRPRADAVAAHAAHSVIAMEDGTFRTFGNGDHGRLGCLDRFKRADPRDKGLPVEMALPAEPKRRLRRAELRDGAAGAAPPPARRRLSRKGLDHRDCCPAAAAAELLVHEVLHLRVALREGHLAVGRPRAPRRRRRVVVQRRRERQRREARRVRELARRREVVLGHELVQASCDRVLLLEELEPRERLVAEVDLLEPVRAWYVSRRGGERPIRHRRASLASPRTAEVASWLVPARRRRPEMAACSGRNSGARASSIMLADCLRRVAFDGWYKAAYAVRTRRCSGLVWAMAFSQGSQLRLARMRRRSRLDAAACVGLLVGLWLMRG